MRSNLAQLMHKIEVKKVFNRDGKDIRLKVLAAPLYFFLSPPSVTLTSQFLLN